MESIDQSVLDQLGENMGGEGAVARIVAMYLGKLPGEADGLHRSANSPDLEKLGEDAHRLKSSTAMLGATGLAVILAELEAAAKTGDTGAVAGLLGRFDDEKAKVERDLSSVATEP